MRIEDICLRIREYEPAFGGLGGNQNEWIKHNFMLFGDHKELYGIVSEISRVSRDIYLLSAHQKRALNKLDVKLERITLSGEKLWTVNHEILHTVRERIGSGGSS